MRYTLWTLIIVLVLSNSLVQAQNDISQIQMDVAYLSSDLLEGRSTGTKGAAMAREYIAKRFQTMGLSPKGEEGSYYHTFQFKYKKNPHAEGEGENRVGKNVVAMIDNGAKNTVVIGAHYDHLGWGDAGSLYTGDPAIHNGADDNASGVAAILNVAEALTESKAKSNNYLFIALLSRRRNQIIIFLSPFREKRWVCSVPKISH